MESHEEHDRLCRVERKVDALLMQGERIMADQKTPKPTRPAQHPDEHPDRIPPAPSPDPQPEPDRG